MLLVFDRAAMGAPHRRITSGAWIAVQSWPLQWRLNYFLFFVPHAHSDSSCCEVSPLVSIVGSGSARSVPCVEAPHAGHDSAFFDLISAPQHPQNAAMHHSPSARLMNAARSTILPTSRASERAHSPTQSLAAAHTLTQDRSRVRPGHSYVLKGRYWRYPGISHRMRSDDSARFSSALPVANAQRSPYTACFWCQYLK